jgi:hypothetical protein
MKNLREELYTSMQIWSNVVGKTRDEIEEKNRRIDEYNRGLRDKYMNILTDDEIIKEYNERIDEKIKIIEKNAQKEINKLESKKVKI